MRGQKRQTPLLEHQYLTPDLWREVLLRLPAKTLLRFRCVCKTWRCFIDSPDFISLHLKIYKDNCANTYLLAAERIPKTFFDYNFTIRRSDTIRKTAQLVKFTDSQLFILSDMIDGLLLMRCSDSKLSNSSDLSLWNPCIRKYVLLPRCPLNSRSDVEKRFHLGFDSSGNDYKVVGFELGDYKASELSIAIAIYSLRDHCWRVKPSWINIPRCWFELIQSRYGVVYCQGTLYWRPYGWFIGGCTHLLSFDLNAEEFSYVKIPDIGKGMLRFCFLLGGSLALLGISQVRACVWVMEKNAGKEPWRQFSSGESKLDAFEFFDECNGHSSWVMYIENSGTLLVHKFNKLMLYNIVSHQVQQTKYFRCSNLVTYLESLVLHKGAAST